MLNKGIMYKSATPVKLIKDLQPGSKKIKNLWFKLLKTSVC